MIIQGILQENKVKRKRKNKNRNSGDLNESKRNIKL